MILKSQLTVLLACACIHPSIQSYGGFDGGRHLSTMVQLFPSPYKTRLIRSTSASSALRRHLDHQTYTYQGRSLRERQTRWWSYLCCPFYLGLEKSIIMPKRTFHSDCWFKLQMLLVYTSCSISLQFEISLNRESKSLHRKQIVYPNTKRGGSLTATPFGVNLHLLSYLNNLRPKFL